MFFCLVNPFFYQCRHCNSSFCASLWLQLLLQ